MDQVLTVESAKPWYSSRIVSIAYAWNSSTFFGLMSFEKLMEWVCVKCWAKDRRNTFIGTNKPLKLPRQNLVMMAIQKFTLTPKRVLKMTLWQAALFRYEIKQIWEIKNKKKWKITNTEAISMSITGFLP